MTGWHIAVGIAIWCAMAFAVTLFIAGSARLRDRSRPTPHVSVPADGARAAHVPRLACCWEGVEGPMHHDAICVAAPCCPRCPQADPRRAS
jgi:hypothetical protein